jgi:hypothetical protein
MGVSSQAGLSCSWQTAARHAIAEHAIAEHAIAEHTIAEAAKHWRCTLLRIFLRFVTESSWKLCWGSVLVFQVLSSHDGNAPASGERFRGRGTTRRLPLGKAESAQWTA